MSLNRAFIGRSQSWDEVYEVSREKIRDYALATGDMHPAYTDAKVARSLGYPDVIAPPSFAVMLFFRYGGWPLYDGTFGKKKAPVCVHRAQRATHYRPIHAGDRLLQTTVVNDVTDIGPHEQFTMTHEISTVEGERVCTIVNTIISRGTAGVEGQ
ncbi:MAG TPA: MaoC family dehydratase N-terminal domain-containing protein [Polyangiaceae bacterium]|nr:MaoC family dehydratase N-terminal domain-containing protein [Polyangiaceae bacterium]